MKLFLFLLFVHQVLAKDLECRFSGDEKFDNWLLGPYRCVIDNVSLKSPEENITLTGDPIDKDKTTALDITNSNIILIPDQILKGFRQLIGLLLRNCSIEVLTRHHFDDNFKNIKYLQISNKLKTIEEEALRDLVSLEWFNVENNAIETVGRIFTKTRKLEYVNFRGNKITAVSTKIFQDLAKINIAKFEGNLCVSTDFVDVKTNKEWLTGLDKCFQRCMAVNCDSSVENAMRLTLARDQTARDGDTTVGDDVIMMMQYVTIVFSIGLTIFAYQRFCTRRVSAHK